LAGHRVDSAVVDPGRLHLDRSGRGQDVALAGVAVAHHQPPPALVPLSRMRGQLVVDLGFQRGRQHPPGALTGQLVQIGVQLSTRTLAGDYTQHCGVTLLAGAPTPVPT
jgi:hypothetical protein